MLRFWECSDLSELSISIVLEDMWSPNERAQVSRKNSVSLRISNKYKGKRGQVCALQRIGATSKLVPQAGVLKKLVLQRE